MEWLVGGVHAW